MKRLVISGLLSLAAVSCGSSDKLKDAKTYFCGGAGVAAAEADKTKLTSCHGAFWTGIADKAACEKQVAAYSGIPTMAAATTKEATTIDKWTDAERADLIKETTTAKFKETAETMKAACQLVGIK